jgi:hypothetical protein
MANIARALSTALCGTLAGPLTLSGAEIFLPIALGTPLIANANMRLVSGYAGPAFQGKNAGAVLADIPFDGSGVASVASIASNGTNQCNKWYNQGSLGSAGDLVNNGTDALPSIDTTLPYPCPAIIFGMNDATGSTVRNLQTTGLSLSQNSITEYYVWNPINNSTNGFYEYTKSGASALCCFALNGTVGPYFTNFGANPGKFLRTQLSYVAYAADASSQSVYMRESRYDTGAPSAGTLDKYVMGSHSNFVGAGAKVHYLARIVYAGKHTPAQAQTVIDVLKAKFNIPSVFTSKLVSIGDSITEGYGARWNLFNQVTAPGIELINLGQGNDTFSSHGQAGTFEGTEYTAAYGVGNCKFYNAYGINDIGNSTYANAAALYTAMTTWNTNIHALGSGARTTIATLIVSAIATAGAKETFRTTYNGLVRANVAGLDSVADMDGIPITSSDQFDSVHPTRAGYLKEVPTLMAAL